MASMHAAVIALRPPVARKVAPIVLLAAFAMGELGWLSVHGVVFTGFAPVVWATLVLSAISVAYGVSGRSAALSEMSYYAALWIVLALVGVILSYICATEDRPLLDEAFTRADRALGFDWMRFYGFVQEHSNVRLMLTIAYFSGLPQIFCSIIFLAHIRRDDRNEELWWGCAIALILTSFLSGLFPAGGTLYYHQVGLDDAVHLPHFLALRAGHLTHFAFRELAGIVSFPSYHTVMALMLIYAYRELYGFRYVFALNIVMLVSTPINGGHYLVDMIGGAAVTVVAAFLAHRIRLVLSAQVQPSQGGRHVFGKSRNRKSVA